jgi:hypothetical protein
MKSQMMKMMKTGLLLNAAQPKLNSSEPLSSWRSIKKIHRLNADCAAAVWGNALHSDAFWLLTHGMGAVQGKFGLKICAAA